MSLIAQGIHHGSAMLTYQGAALTIEVEVLFFALHNVCFGFLLGGLRELGGIVRLGELYFPYYSTSFFIQSKPRFSISSASSGPAVFTMRPL